MSNYDELLKEYREINKNYQKVRGELDELTEAFRLETGHLVAIVNALKSTLEGVDKELRELVRADHEAGNELPAGFGVRRVKDYIYNPADALKWAKETGLCLTLDTKAFKDICKSDSNRPDFVELGETITPTISPKLYEEG